VFPEYSHGPVWTNFPDRPTLNLAVTALLDAMLLVYAARLFLEVQHCGWTDTYLRYFRADQLDEVRKRFDWISGEDGFGPDLMEEALQIRWKLDEGETESRCDKESLFAYFGQEKKSGIWTFDIVLCPTVFDTDESRNSLKDEIDHGCDNFGDRADPGMDIPGATVLHELLHWHAITGGGLKDWMAKDHGRVLPKIGYGAYNSMLVGPFVEIWGTLT
jgi:hypothetical protein